MILTEIRAMPFFNGFDFNNTKYFFQQKVLTADVRVSSNSLDTTAVIHSNNYDSHLICSTFLGRFCIFSTCPSPRWVHYSQPQFPHKLEHLYSSKIQTFNMRSLSRVSVTVYVHAYTRQQIDIT